MRSMPEFKVGDLVAYHYPADSSSATFEWYNPPLQKLPDGRGIYQVRSMLMSSLLLAGTIEKRALWVEIWLCETYNPLITCKKDIEALYA